MRQFIIGIFFISFSLLMTPSFLRAASIEKEKLYCEAPPAPSRAPSSVRSPKSVRAPNQVTVIEADPTFDAQALSAQGYDVISYEEFNNPNAWADPSPKLRDFLFHEAGLDHALAKWDQLSRDMLFLRAQEYPLKRLTTKYPQIPPAQLDLLLRKIGIAKQTNGDGGAK
jgi:hypothetical protein